MKIKKSLDQLNDNEREVLDLSEVPSNKTNKKLKHRLKIKKKFKLHNET